MSIPKFVNEPVLVQARFLPDGQLQPTAFTWRRRIRTIVDRGRQWQEEVEGTIWHCYLVRTTGQQTFELRINAASGRWVLARAWLAAPAHA